jgi:charged multivesicular body protein 1
VPTLLTAVQAIEKGNMEGARIYAQNAIRCALKHSYVPLISYSREKNQALNFLRLASRIDAVASRVETAVRMRTVTGSMANIVRGMEQALQTMDMQKITMVRKGNACSI